MVWKNSSSDSKVGHGDLASFLIFIFPVTAVHNVENQEVEVRELDGRRLRAEVWRRFLSPPDATWLLRFRKTEEMGVNSSQLMNTEPLQN